MFIPLAVPGADDLTGVKEHSNEQADKEHNIVSFAHWNSPKLSPPEVDDAAPLCPLGGGASALAPPLSAAPCAAWVVGAGTLPPRLIEMVWGGASEEKMARTWQKAHRLERIVLLWRRVVLALSLLGLLLNLVVLLKVLQRHVKVKGMVALLEADADRAPLALFVLNGHHEVAAAVRHRLDRVAGRVVARLRKELAWVKQDQRDHRLKSQFQPVDPSSILIRHCSPTCTTRSRPDHSHLLTSQSAALGTARCEKIKEKMK